MEEALKRLLDIILEEIHPDKVILFGSRARQDFGEASDYDLLIIKTGLKHPRRELKRLYSRISGIGVPADLILVETKRFEDLKDNPYMIFHEVNIEGRTIYAKA